MAIVLLNRCNVLIKLLSNHLCLCPQTTAVSGVESSYLTGGSDRRHAYAVEVRGMSVAV